MLEITPPVVPPRHSAECRTGPLTGSASSTSVGTTSESDEDTTQSGVQDPALILLSLWMAWPNACLSWQREVHDTWVALWAGGVPLDG